MRSWHTVFQSFWHFLWRIGAYIYLQRLKLAQTAAVFGAVGFMFCGFMVGHRVHLGVIQTACMLPWLLWCIELLRDKRAMSFALLVPIGFLTFAAGHWPTLIQMSVVVFAYFLLRGRPFWPSLGVAAGAVVLILLIFSPQIHAASELLGQTSRQKIGYHMAGENSFFPLAGVLAFFPFLMGSRTAAGNFFPQQWWGPWHLCEMLGYVGLITLPLAGAAIWQIAKGKRSSGNPNKSIAKIWTLIAIGAFVWMLGFYLPTYRLIYMLPVLGVMRCPARMVLALDMALITLAAIGIDAIIKSANTENIEKLKITIRRTASFVLPAAMAVSLCVIWLGAFLLLDRWPENIPTFGGGAKDALAALSPANPAIWVPVGLLVLTIIGIRIWLKFPRKMAAVLIVLLFVDLFFITRFIDVPGKDSVVADPEISQAAEWLRENAQANQPYLVWGLADSYTQRPAELLLPKTAQSLGVATINSYGPFQSPAHGQLLGFRIFGNNENWAELLRRNYLLSSYNVRYILTADEKYRDVIESVRIKESARHQGENLVSSNWQLEDSIVSDDGFRLQGSWLYMWQQSAIKHEVKLKPGRVYRIALDANCPQGQAGSDLKVEVYFDYYTPAEHMFFARNEHLSSDWRHFEWTFVAPNELPHPYLRIFTTSEFPIDVRNISLAESEYSTPVNLANKLQDSQRVYKKLIELPARNPQDNPVVIYENLLAKSPGEVDKTLELTSSQIELYKWQPGSDFSGVPAVAIGAREMPGSKAGLLLIFITVPGILLYVIIVLLLKKAD